MCFLRALELSEERFVDFICCYRFETKFKMFKHIDKFLSINEFDWWNTIS